VLYLCFEYDFTRQTELFFFSFFTEIPFPKSFKKTIKTIMKRMLRVYSHIYCHHIDIVLIFPLSNSFLLKVREIGEEVHLNTCFLHFYYFNTVNSLVEKLDLLPVVCFSFITIAFVILFRITGKRNFEVVRR